MKVFNRRLRPEDFDQCWNFLAARHTLGPNGKKATASGWNALLEGEAMQGAIVLDLDAAKANAALAFGVSVFVQPDWLSCFLKDPQPYVLVSLVAGHDQPKSPILTERQIARANAGEGLCLLVVQHGWNWPANSQPSTEVGHSLIQAFQREHRGFNIREMAREIYGDLARDFCAAGDNWKQHSDYSNYFLSASVPLPAHEDHPYLMRAIRGKHPAASVLWSMLRFSPPFLGLSQGQRQVMKLAARGVNRPQIATELGQSQQSVRNSQRAVLGKAKKHPRTAGLFKDAAGRELPTKVQSEVLLEFLEKSYEELRPWPRRALPR